MTEAVLTKARTRSERIRDRKRNRDISLPGGETAAPKPTQGVREPKEPPNEVAISARVRRLGLPENEASRSLVQSQMAGCQVGAALMSDKGLPSHEVAELWDAVMHMRKVVVAYGRAIGAPGRHAQCMRILAPTQAMHADAESPPLDTRDDAAKERAATAAWSALHGWLQHADRAAQSACLRCVVDEPDAPIGDWHGVILALRCVVDGRKGRRVTVRDRGRA